MARPRNLIDHEMIDEIKKMKEEKKATWTQIYTMYKCGGGSKEYKGPESFGYYVRVGSVPDMDIILKALKDLPNLKKKEPKRKGASFKQRGFYAYEAGRRLHKVYAKENGLFGLQEEYLE